MNIEQGQVWEKKSFPFPTIVRIVSVTGESVTVALEGRKKHITLPQELFLGQGFARRGDA